MVKAYAWINKSTHLIENMIMWDGVSPLVVPDGYEVVEAPELHGEWSWLGIGWKYLNGEFIEPANPNPPVSQQVIGGAPSVIA
jgi:hypothetical protein